MPKTEHNNKKLVMGEIQQLIDLSDALAIEERTLQAEAEETLKNVIKQEKEGGDTGSVLKDWRALTAKITFVGEDLTTVLRMIMGYFMAVKSLGWEDSLKPTDKERLEYLIEHNPTIFTVTEEGLKPRDESLVETALENVKEKEEFNESFLDTLKESQLYQSYGEKEEK